MANYWTTLKCTTKGGSGGVSSTFSKSVQPGKSVTFTPTFSVSTGGTINCQICFENWGVPKPGGGIDYSQKYSKCNDAGSFTAKRGCECKDFKDSEGVPYQSSCASGAVGVNTQNFGGSAGFCKVCRSCSYDNSSWTGPEPSNACAGTTYTRTLQSSVKYGGTTFTSGCPQQTKQATGTGVPTWGIWTPGEGTKCASAGLFTQTKTDINGYCSPQTKQVTGTMEPDWSDCVGGFRFDKNACAQEEACDCECPAGWLTAAPAASVSTGLQCPEGQTLQTTGGTGENPCETCYKCEACDVYDWYPSEGEVCAGVSFMQAGYGYNCSLAREAVGTMGSSWVSAETCDSVQYDSNGCLPDRTVDVPACCSDPAGCPCSWRIIEVGEGRAVVYQSGGPGTSPPSSWTPPTYSYEGYMELQRNCGNGWATEQQWITLNGGPTQSLS
jgi:hypothetical protein